jgi:hypothetical protein
MRSCRTLKIALESIKHLPNASKSKLVIFSLILNMGNNSIKGHGRKIRVPNGEAAGFGNFRVDFSSDYDWIKHLGYK